MLKDGTFGVRSGVKSAGSSDNPVVSPDPVLGMRDSIMRKTEEGRVLAPEQRLDPEQALTMFTKEATYSFIEENDLGTIGEGKQADMVILSEDPLSTPPETWEKQMRVEMTIVGGEIVYTSNQFKAVN